MEAKLTKQGVRDLGGNDKRRKKVELPSNCSHEKSRLVPCGGGACNGRPCTWKCPDCGFTWQLGEGIYG